MLEGLADTLPSGSTDAPRPSPPPARKSQRKAPGANADGRSLAQTPATTPTPVVAPKIASLSGNRFSGLLDDSDDDDSRNASSSTACSGSSSISGDGEGVAPGFSLAPASFGASKYAASLVSVQKPGLMTSTFGDMSTLVGALGQAEVSAADVSEAQRVGGANRSWDLSGLHNAAIGVIPERQRFNPLFGRSLAEHERDVIKLQRGLQNSTRQMKMQNQRRKNNKQQSRKSNVRKSAKQARGEAMAAKYAKRLGGSGGRKRRNRSGRKARAKPY